MPLFNPPGGGSGLTAINISASNTSENLSNLVFSNSNGISFGLTGSTLTGTVATNYLTTAMASNRGSDFVQAAAAFAGTSASGTIASNGISVSIGPYITTAMLSNAATISNIKVSAGTLSAHRSDLTFANSNGISFGLETNGIVTATVQTNYLTTAALSNHSHGVSFTSGSIGFQTLSFTNSNGFSFNSSTQGVFGSYTVPSVTEFLTTAALSNHSHGNPTLALTNLTGTTASASNGFTLSLSAAAPGGGAVVSNAIQDVGSATGSGTNTSRFAADDHVHRGIGGIAAVGTASTFYGSFHLSAGNNVTLSTAGASNAGSVAIHVAAPGGGATISQFDPFLWQNVTNSTLGQSTVYFVPFTCEQNVYGSRVNFFLSNSRLFSGAPNNQTAWLAFGYGLYIRGVGANSTHLELSTSYSLSYVSGSCSSSTRVSLTHYVGLSNATSHSTSQYGVQNASVTSYIANSINGFRVLALPLNVTLTPGAYWLGVSNQSASQNGSFTFNHSVLQAQFSNLIAYRVFNSNSAASNASFFPASNGVGVYSAQTAAFPANIPINSDTIRAAPVATLPYFNISGIGTAINIL